MTPDLFDRFSDNTSSDNDQEDKNTVTLTLVIHDEKQSVIFVTETGEGKPIMLPLKSITVEPTGRRTSAIGKPKLAIAEIAMPMWLAKDRGLISYFSGLHIQPPNVD